MLSLGGLFLVRGITNLINKGSLIVDRLDIELGENCNFGNKQYCC